MQKDDKKIENFMDCLILKYFSLGYRNKESMTNSEENLFWDCKSESVNLYLLYLISNIYSSVSKCDQY